MSGQFLADRTKGRAIGTVLRLSSSVCLYINQNLFKCFSLAIFHKLQNLILKRHLTVDICNI